MGARASRPPPFSSIICDRNRATAQFQADSRLVPLGREKGNGVRGRHHFRRFSWQEESPQFLVLEGGVEPLRPLENM